MACGDNLGRVPRYQKYISEVAPKTRKSNKHEYFYNVLLIDVQKYYDRDKTKYSYEYMFNFLKEHGTKFYWEEIPNWIIEDLYFGLPSYHNVRDKGFKNLRMYVDRRLRPYTKGVGVQHAHDYQDMVINYMSENPDFRGCWKIATRLGRDNLQKLIDFINEGGLRQGAVLRRYIDKFGRKDYIVKFAGQGRVLELPSEEEDERPDHIGDVAQPEFVSENRWNNPVELKDIKFLKPNNYRPSGYDLDPPELSDGSDEVFDEGVSSAPYVRFGKLEDFENPICDSVEMLELPSPAEEVKVEQITVQEQCLGTASSSSVSTSSSESVSDQSCICEECGIPMDYSDEYVRVKEQKKELHEELVQFHENWQIVRSDVESEQGEEPMEVCENDDEGYIRVPDIVEFPLDRMNVCTVEDEGYNPNCYPEDFSINDIAFELYRKERELVTLEPCSPVHNTWQRVHNLKCQRDEDKKEEFDDELFQSYMREIFRLQELEEKNFKVQREKENELIQKTVSVEKKFDPPSRMQKKHPSRVFKRKLPEQFYDGKTELNEWIAQVCFEQKCTYGQAVTVCKRAYLKWLAREKKIKEMEISLERDIQLLKELKLNKNKSQKYCFPSLGDGAKWRQGAKSYKKKQRRSRAPREVPPRFQKRQHSRESMEIMDCTDETFTNACQSIMDRPAGHFSAGPAYMSVKLVQGALDQDEHLIGCPNKGTNVSPFLCCKYVMREDPDGNHLYADCHMNEEHQRNAALNCGDISAVNFEEQSLEDELQQLDKNVQTDPLPSPTVKEASAQLADVVYASIEDLTFDKVEQFLGTLKPMTSFHLFAQTWYARSWDERLHYITMLAETHNLFWTPQLNDKKVSIVAAIAAIIAAIKTGEFFNWLSRGSRQNESEIRLSQSESVKVLDLEQIFVEQAFVELPENPDAGPTILNQFGIDVKPNASWSPYLVCTGIVAVLATLFFGAPIAANSSILSEGFVNFHSMARFTRDGKTLLQNAKELFDWIMSTLAGWVGLQWIPEKDKQMHDLKEKATRVYKDVLALFERVSISPIFLFRDDTAFKKLEASVKEVDQMYADLIKIDKSVSNLKPMMDNLKSKYDHIHNVVKDIRAGFQAKQEPVCLYFAGPTGVGKSKLVKHIVKRLSELEGKPLTTYTRFAGDEFNSGYQGQDVFFYDDFNRTTEDTDLNELDAIITPSAYPMNMADLSDKGKYFSSRYVIICSNMPYPKSSTFYQTNILDRRRDHLVWVESPGLNAYMEAHQGNTPPPDSDFYKKDWSHLVFTKMDSRRDHQNDPGVEYPLEFFITDAFKRQVTRREEWLLHVHAVAQQMQYTKLIELSEEDKIYLEEQKRKANELINSLPRDENFGRIVQNSEMFTRVARSIQLETQKSERRNFTKGKNLQYHDEALDVPEVYRVSTRVSPPPKVLFTGPPGCGKTTIARQISSIVRDVEKKSVLLVTGSSFSSLKALVDHLEAKGPLDLVLIDDWCVNDEVFEVFKQFVFAHDNGDYPFISKVIMTANDTALEARIESSNTDIETKNAFLRRFEWFKFSWRMKPGYMPMASKLAQMMKVGRSNPDYDEHSFKVAMKEGKAYEDCVTIQLMQGDVHLIYSAATLVAYVRNLSAPDLDCYQYIALPVIGDVDTELVLKYDDTAMNFCKLFTAGKMAAVGELRRCASLIKGSFMTAFTLISEWREAEDKNRVVGQSTAEAYFLDILNRQVVFTREFSMTIHFSDMSICLATDEKRMMHIFKILPNAKVSIEGKNFIVQSSDERVQFEADLVYRSTYELHKTLLSLQKERSQLKSEANLFDDVASKCMGFAYMLKSNSSMIWRTFIFIVRMCVAGMNMSKSWSYASDFHFLRKWIDFRAKHVVDESDLGRDPLRCKTKSRKLAIVPVSPSEDSDLESEGNEEVLIEESPPDVHERITRPRKTKSVVKTKWTEDDIKLAMRDPYALPESRPEFNERISRPKQSAKKVKVWTDDDIKHAMRDPYALHPEGKIKICEESEELERVDFDMTRFESWDLVNQSLREDWEKSIDSILDDKAYRNVSHISATTNAGLYPSSPQYGPFEFDKVQYKNMFQCFTALRKVKDVKSDLDALRLFKEIITAMCMSSARFAKALDDTRGKVLISRFVLKGFSLPKNWYGLLLMQERAAALSYKDQLMSDPSARPVIRVVRNNIVQMIGLNGNRVCAGTMICGHIGVTVAHIVKDGRKTFEVEYMGTRYNATEVIKDTWKDWMIFRLEKKAPLFRNVYHFLPSEKAFPDYNKRDALLVTTEHDDRSLCYDNKPIRLSAVAEYKVGDADRYGIQYTGTTIGFSYTTPINTERGDCGHPVFVLDTSLNKKFVAIHSAGSERYGMGAILTCEMFKPYLEKFNDQSTDDLIIAQPWQGVQSSAHDPEIPEGFSLFGECVHHQFHPQKTQIWRSPFSDPDIIPDLYEPSVLSERDKRLPENFQGDVYWDAIGKWGRKQPKLDLKELDIVFSEIADYYADEVFTKLPGQLVTVLDRDTSLNSHPRMEKSNQIYRGSSAGYPWKHLVRTDGKSSFLKPDLTLTGCFWRVDNSKEVGQKLCSAVENLIELARCGTRTAVVFAGNLKDECLKKKKIREEPKTRSFAGAPFDYTIAMRMYFHAAYSAISALHHTAPAKVGIDPNSLDWKRLYEWFASCSDIAFDADYSNWDAFVPYEFMKRVPVVYNRIYQKCDEQYDPEHDKIRTVLHSHLWGPLLTFKDFIVRAPGGNVSGQPGTTVDNCIVNIAYFYYAWRKIMRANNRLDLVSFPSFMSKIRLGVYGDDNVCALSSEVKEIFNLEVYADFMKRELDITVTDALKTGKIVKYKPLIEVEFLKRNFVRSRNVYLAPLVKDVFSKMIHWTTHQSRRYAWCCQDTERWDQETLESSAESLLREAFNWGPQLFNRLRDHVMEVFKDLSIMPRSLPTIQQLLDERGMMVGMQEQACDHPVQTKLGKPLDKVLETARFFYLPVFLAKTKHEKLFPRLKNELPWKNYQGSRKECYFGPAYKYNKISMPAQFLDQEQYPTLAWLLEKVRIATALNFDMILCNWYDSKRGIGYHKDDEESIRPFSSIVTVSFGKSCNVWIRGKDFEKRFRIKAGSLYMMGNCFQSHYSHRVDIEEERISVTFRQSNSCDPLLFIGDYSDSDEEFQFEEPQRNLEQYLTPQKAAIQCLEKIKGDIEGKSVMDLGAGTGALTARILDHNPESVTAVEIDHSLKEQFLQNINYDPRVNLISSDIRNVVHEQCDTIISNPPFGCYEDGAMEMFCDAIPLNGAKVAYFFHLKGKVQDVTRYMDKKYGYKVETLLTFPYLLPKTMKQHKHDNYFVGVSFIKIWK